MTAAPAAAPRPSSRGWLPWIAMAVVVVATLLYGTFGQPDPTPAQRAQSIADGIRCPSCKSQAVSSSDTPASKAVRELIKEQIAAGKSNEEIRDYVDSRYPDQNLLLDPSGSGFPILVWALPVIFVIVAVAGLVVRFRDYRPGTRAVTDADRDLVADALVSAPASAPQDGAGPPPDEA